MTDTYGDKTYQDVVKNYVTSQGHSAANTYTNQTFSDVLSRWNSATSSIGYDGIEGAGWLTEALQTYNRGGHCAWFSVGSTCRFFYVDEPTLNSGSFTVAVYNTNTTTNTYLTNTYGGKTYQDVVRAYVISRGHSVANTYTNQTFSDVLSKWNSVGSTASNNAALTSSLTERLQTQNRSGHSLWFPTSGSNYRYFYVTQE
jgi:hypothetical protein